jgi:cell division protein FtsB
MEKTELQDELDDLMKLRAQLELQIKDLEDDQLSGSELEVTSLIYFVLLNPLSNHLLFCFQARITAQVDQLDKEITIQEQKVNEITPQYNQLEQSDSDLRKQ